MELNPYISGQIVTKPERFVGRKSILEQVMKELANKKFILLYGQRRVGKSSLLFRIASELQSDGKRFIPVYCSLEGQLDMPVEKLLGTIANTIHGVCDLKETSHIQDVISMDEFISSWLPKAMIEVKSQKGKGIVLLLDEFDAISDYIETKNADNFYLALRNLLEANSQIKLVAVISRHPSTMINSAKSLLEYAVDINIPLMSYIEIEELTRLSRNALEWKKDAIEKLWALTRGHPLLAQTLCSTIWTRFFAEILAHKMTAIQEADVDSARFVLTNELGHVVDYAWSLLNTQEQFTICYLATSSKGAAVVDMLNYLEINALSDYFRIPTLASTLSGLASSDWVEQNDNSYTIKIPIFSDRIKQTQELSSFQDILFDDRARAFALLDHAKRSRNDLNAIDDYRKSLTIYPDDESTQTLLVGRYHRLIEYELNKGENGLALNHIKDLARYETNSLTIQKLEQSARTNIKVDVAEQKIDWAAHEEDFLEGYRLMVGLGNARSKLERQSYVKLIWSHISYITIAWFKALALSSPSIIALVFLSPYSYRAEAYNQTQKYDLMPFAAVIGVTLLASFITSFLSVGVKKILENRSLQSAIINTLGILFFFSGIYSIPTYFILIITMLIALGTMVTLFPDHDFSYKMVWDLIIDGALILWCVIIILAQQ